MILCHAEKWKDTIDPILSQVLCKLLYWTTFLKQTDWRSSKIYPHRKFEAVIFHDYHHVPSARSLLIYSFFTLYSSLFLQWQPYSCFLQRKETLSHWIWEEVPSGSFASKSVMRRSRRFRWRARSTTHLRTSCTGAAQGCVHARAHIHRHTKASSFSPPPLPCFSYSTMWQSVWATSWKSITLKTRSCQLASPSPSLASKPNLMR